MTRTQRTVGALAIMMAFVVVVTAFALSTLRDPVSEEAAGAGDSAGGEDIGEPLATAASGVTRTVTATRQLTIPAGVVRLTETPSPVTRTVATTGTVVREDIRTVTAEGVRTERVTERVTERATVTETVGGGATTVTDVVTETVAGPGATVTETVPGPGATVTETVQGPGETVTETVTVQGAAPPPETVTVGAQTPPPQTVTETQTVAADSGQ